MKTRAELSIDVDLIRRVDRAIIDRSNPPANNRSGLIAFLLARWLDEVPEVVPVAEPEKAPQPSLLERMEAAIAAKAETRKEQD